MYVHKCVYLVSLAFYVGQKTITTTMLLHMYVRTYIRTYVRTYVRMYVRTYIRTYVRTYVLGMQQCYNNIISIYVLQYLLLQYNTIHLIKISIYCLLQYIATFIAFKVVSI